MFHGKRVLSIRLCHRESSRREAPDVRARQNDSLSHPCAFSTATAVAREKSVREAIAQVITSGLQSCGTSRLASQHRDGELRPRVHAFANDGSPRTSFAKRIALNMSALEKDLNKSRPMIASQIGASVGN
jgi:hypothetical protein